MKTLGPWTVVLAVVTVLASLGTGVQAATTVVDVQLGDTFTGNITAGMDTVEANFSGVRGTRVLIGVKARPGSNLRPTLLLKDASGAPLALGTTSRRNPQTKVLAFSLPRTGEYTVEIGGSSGSGDFAARLRGRGTTPTPTTTLSGTVTNGLTGDPIAGASVEIGSLSLTTDAAGRYSTEIAVGDYTVSAEASNFVAASESVALRSGAAAVVDFGLDPVAPVIVDASISGDAVPGGTVTATATIEVLDGSTGATYAWTQLAGPDVVITGGDTGSPSLTLAAMGAYRDELIHVLSEPPISAEDLPPNVHVHEGEFPGGLQDRFGVVAINPFSLEETGLVVLELEVTTSSGTYHGEVEVHTALPWKVGPGLPNVPIATPVLLHGKDQASYDWTLTPPPASSATLMNATGQNPEFMPDVPGLYEVGITDLTGELDAPLTLEIYAGTWRGVVVDQDVDGRPVSDVACTVCHTTLAPDMFTPWAQTGHAEIFTNNLNTSSYYGSNCFPCHTVGYDTGVANGGADDASDWASFMGSGLIGNPGDNWTAVLEDFPATAQLANIQCENCHGPQSTDAGVDNPAHGWNDPEGDPRVSLSSDVCAVCHGEPLRHARFQQWQLSSHANYELAVGRGQSGSCSRCHTVNGFLEWLPVLLDDDPETDPLESIFYCDTDAGQCVGGANDGNACSRSSDCPPEWTPDNTHPQTCVTCHDPHNIGTTSGNNTNVTLRIEGDTPPLIAGFTVTNAGRGALCMTCHNSRRGLRNDGNFADFLGTSESVRAPHGSAQTDVLTGQNAYLVTVPNPGSHAGLEDTCVTCHMQETPPPDLLAYRQGGANHTFFASEDVCSNCHEGLTAAAVQDGIHRQLDRLQGMIEDAHLALIDELTTAGNTIDLPGDRDITSAGDVAEIVFGESRGRQALTVTFTDTTVVGPSRMSDIDVVGDPGGPYYNFVPDVLLKSGWNWSLIHNDGSDGVHNPIFAFQVLTAARNAVSGGPGVPAEQLERQLRSTWGLPKTVNRR